MRISLVNPPNGLSDVTYLAPPLGLLTLASFIRQFGYEIEIVDLNLEMFEDKSLDGKHFYQKACDLILKSQPDLVGFTSMCLESHVCLEIAKRLKEQNPNIKTAFGGTHFGAIVDELLENFDFVDFVITGEGENAFLSILNKFKSAKLALPENVTYRQNKKIQKGILENKIFPLEEIPFPAYDLVDLERYFKLNPAHLFNYEAGRGCVFKCSFCYSPFQYGDNVRHKSPKLVVEELKKLVNLGAEHIFFVQDNFLNSPRWASEVCRQIAEDNLPITFECYTTYPQLKEQIIDLLAEANCIGIFTGIDAVSVSSQQRMNKPFLKNWGKISEKLSYCLEKGILPICAFILEEPDQEIEKAESVIYTALECIRLGCEVHLNTLSIYNRTRLEKEFFKKDYIYSEIKTELMFDTPKIVQSNHFAKAMPFLFPLHSTHNSKEEWEIFIAKTYLISTLALALTNTLHQFIVEEGKSIWKALNFVDSNFVQWLIDLKPSERRKSVVLEFTKHFTKEKLNIETRNYFYHELANVYLLNLKNKRIVNLLINGSEIKANLSWFVNLNVFGNSSEVKETNNQIVAFLSDKKKVRFYSVPFQLWKVLAQLESASKFGETLSLSQSEKDILLENKWISLKKSTQPVLPMRTNQL